MRKGRPAIFTSASPWRSMVSMSSPNRWETWAGSLGAPMVTTPAASSTASAAASTAAPPRLCPIRIEGAACAARSQSAAATRSSTFELKLVFAKSPPLAPRPVKSKRSVAMPLEASAAAMRDAAKMSFEQVKQCANSA